MQVYRPEMGKKKWKIRPARDPVFGLVWDVYDTSLGWCTYFHSLDRAVDYVMENSR